MATYPNDAKAPITGFGVTTSITYASTGAETTFNLNGTVEFRGEVLAFLDGVVQDTTTYAISNGGATVTFDTAPNASNLTLKTVSVPARFKISRQEFATTAVEYNNTTPKVVDSNSYLINANTTSFALPAGSNAASKGEIMVFLSGLAQSEDSFVFPSTTLGYNGIDISDNAATRLLMNFDQTDADESDYAHTVSSPFGTTYGGTEPFVRRIFNGSSYIKVDDHSDFDLNSKSFTFDTHVQFATGITMASNQTLLARHEDSDNHFSIFTVGANSNVGVQFTHGGDTTEIYGGNANGGVGYHVAVSYDSHTDNLRLYVNNVKVAHTGMAAMAGIGGNLMIGANSDLSSNGEYLKGDVYFLRLADGVRYASDEIPPVDNLSSEAITVASGSPLGAIDQNDQLSIRLFDSQVEVVDRFTSMADRRPDAGFTAQRTFDSVTFSSQAGYEKRRLKSRRSKRSYDLTYTNVTGIEKTAIENFYNARSGEFEAFSFDLSHINEVGTITTRFASPLSVTQVLSTGSQLTENFYTVSFKLQETYD